MVMDNDRAKLDTDYLILYLHTTMNSRDDVSLRDIYDAVGSLEEKMGKRIEKVETNVANLQGFQNKSLGVISVLSLFFSAIASFIWTKITGEK